MPDSTNPGDIWVVGQRSTPGGTFPSAGGNGSGDHGNGGTHSNQDEGEQPGLEAPFNPCAQPDTALEWNADAAAAAALAMFKQKAAELGDTGLYNREFGCQIYQAADGSMYLGPITWGDTMAGAVTIDQSGATSANLIGEIHSHPSPQMEPSSADWDRLNIFSDYTGSNFRSYIVSRDLNDPSSDFAIRVYDTSSDQSSNDPGPLVNPEGSPCP